MARLPSKAHCERLELLIEECSEVIKAATKVMRFGDGAHHPQRPLSCNREELAEEIGNLEAAVTQLKRHGDVDQTVVFEAAEDHEFQMARHVRFTKIRKA